MQQSHRIGKLLRVPSDQTGQVHAGDTDQLSLDEWLSTTESARRLGMTERTVRRLIDSGDLPGYRMGRVIRIKEADLAAFIESCRVEPGFLGER